VISTTVTQPIGLQECISRILDAQTWIFVQLRGKTLSTKDIDGDDVDLLGCQSSIAKLIDAVYSWTCEGLCHAQISARSPNKKLLILYSIDGLHKLTLDLWHAVPQLIGIHHAVSMQDLEPLLTREKSSITRLPITLEACLYIHHLAAKRKDLSKPSAQSRLALYSNACKNDPILVSHLTEIAHAKKINNEALKATLRMLEKRIPNLKNRTSTPIFPAHLKCSRKGALLTIMGCDGVGKTSLSLCVAKELPPPVELLKGKHLYRKCYLFKIAVILIRPLLFQSREKFDESLAFYVYLRACMGLTLKQLFGKKKLTIIDRSIIDFLFLNRKTDTPRWSIFKQMNTIVGSRIPTIHCVANFDIISERKLEMTQQGHAAYDKSMFKHFAHRVPTEYLLFNNEKGCDQSRDTLLEIIKSEEFPLAPKYKVGEYTLQG